VSAELGLAAPTLAPAPGAPTAHVEGGAPWDAVGAQLGGEFLARHLSAQRWSAAKAGPLTGVRAERVLPLPDSDALALAVVAAEADGRAVRYLVPLVRHPHPAPADAGPALVELVGPDGRRSGVHDAAGDPAFQRALHALMAAGGTLVHRDATLAADAFAPPPPGVVTGRTVGGEQSNTSIIYSDGSIIKLFRRVEVGENPDVEIGRAIAARGDLVHVPRLLGALRYADPAGTATLAMRQQLVPGARDVWAYTLDRARADIEAAAGGTVHWSYTGDAERLGAVTRRVHEALAAVTDDAAFAPEPARTAHVAAWAAAAEQAVHRGLDLLSRQLAGGALTGALADEAANMVAWRDAFVARTAATVDTVGDDAGLRIRHHGDYHLGQVLRADSGEFYVIDFEGEPLRPLAERRAKHSPLRDVAGMLRSFAYAAATAAAERGGTAEPGRAPDGRAATWEEQARTSFLRGYGAPGAGAAFLPSSAERAAALVSLFETEKLFYELAYELQNRPAWVWIPLLGISQLLGR
jgi:maltose alpha-D-glucosyltransferase/alpha-amylase